MSYPDQNDTLNTFHRLNIRRMSEAFAPAHSLPALVLCVQEEVGELAAAVLGFTGEKKRKAHLTREDVLDAVADAMTYLSLVAGSVGCDDLEALLGGTFNSVSERAGSNITTTLGDGRMRPLLREAQVPPVVSNPPSRTTWPKEPPTRQRALCGKPFAPTGRCNRFEGHEGDCDRREA